MKYKNITKSVLEFRAFNLKGDKVVFSVQPYEEIETKDKIRCVGMEKIKEKKKKEVI